MNPSDAPDRYSDLHLLGQGGMGRVFRARDTVLQRNVALKVVGASPVELREQGLDPAESIARLVREARAAASLDHPNIVTIYDVVEFPTTEGKEPFCFIAMELIEGRALREYIGKKEVPLEQRGRWLADVARALAFAHERGIIHRDVKPDNVMIRDDGVVKVLDFGLARQAAGMPATPGREVLPTLTEEGRVLGTPRYMAPEQMGGEVLDARADQFSWGVVAYELLAGQLPWPAARDSIQLVAQVLTNEPAPLCGLVPLLSPEFADIVHRAIARDKRARFDSMDALLEAMQATPVSSASPGSASAPTVARRPRRSLARWASVPFALAVGATLIGAAAVGGDRFRRMPDHPAQAASRACRSNAECTSALGVAAICRRDTAACVALGSDDCHVVAEETDVGNDATVWFGAMFPFVGEEARSFGEREFAAVDLARSDFAEMLRGTNARPGATGGHPLALLACDDATDASRAARHLVDEVGVPAIIGFRTSKEVIDLATSIFIPRGVLAIAALNTSPIIASLPNAPGQLRTVFRTTYSSAEAATPIALLLSQVLEPEIRAQSRAGRRDPLRVALVRQEDPAGIGFADSLFRDLRFNGRSALENESNYRELAYPFEERPGKEPGFETIVDELREFAPHVVVHFGADDAFLRIVEPLEEGWRADVPRPRYVKPTALPPSVLQFVGASAERRRRFFAVTSASTTAANARFVARYSELHPKEVSRTFSPNSSYDAFYVLAYATLAVGGERVTGTSLARAIGRLLPPGRPIDVGPSGIFEALNALSSGERIDLNGATGRLDFSLYSGEAPVDLAILCVKSEANGSAPELVESGLTYDATAGALRGALHCP
jgi:serine/threonine-protein kinase